MPTNAPNAPAHWVALRGRDYPELGPIGSVGLPGVGALALSRGAYPKAYAHVDPNEDGALLYRGADATLLCVVDGYNGARASEVALDATLARADALGATADADFGGAVEALLADAGEALEHERRSRSCLLLASVRGHTCRWASFGDSFLFRSTHIEPENSPNDLIVGRGLRTPNLPPELWMGIFELEPGERIAAVSDGIPNFFPDPSRICELLRDGVDDLSTATALARGAMKGGAGDNVAVATLRAYPG
jgi:serine/threonine protein phosphatase PrpC